MKKISQKLKKIFLFESLMNGWDKVGNLPDPTGNSGGHPIAVILEKVLNWLLGIFGLLAVISFIIAGFLYLTAQGDEQQIQKSKKALLYGIVGIVVGLMGLIVIKTIDALLRGGTY